jgi:predicted nucleic acid-binding Zn finger protein
VVPPISEKEVFNKLYNEISRTQCVNELLFKSLVELMGKRFIQAHKAIEDEKVKKYIFYPTKKIVWIVNGKEGDYQILPKAAFCSCNDFYFRVISNEIFLCYHLVAQKLAEALGKYVLIKKSDEDYKTQMSKWRKIKLADRSLSIKEVGNVRRLSEAVLSEIGALSIYQLVEEIEKNGLRLTTRHLANILTTDRKKRFKGKKGLWTLTTGK